MLRLLRSLPLFALLLLSTAALAGEGKLTVHFLDVGQGDSALVISPSGKTVLIDAGPPDHAAQLVSRVKELVHGPLDLVIMTHPHLDHLGGMVEVIRAVGARMFLEPGFDQPSAGYTELLKVVGEKKIAHRLPQPDAAHPERPVRVRIGGDAVFEVLWPRAPVEPFLDQTRSDANSNSIVARLVYGKTAILFTGDAEPDTEEKLLQSGVGDLRATVLKVGHHGGRFSTNDPFLDRIVARAAVISCGKGNDYGHPTQAVLDRLTNHGVKTYRTDQDGEVLLESDGARITIGPLHGGSSAGFDGGIVPPADLLVSLAAATPAAESAPAAEVAPAAGSALDEGAVQPASATVEGYFASKRSAVFHRAGCKAREHIRAVDLLSFDAREAAAKGRRPAKDCSP